MDTILVVDDEEFIAEVIALFLAEEGPTVMTAGSTQEALIIAIEEHPDMVLTDVMIPRMGSVELCELLRGDSATCAIVVLLMSAAVATNAPVCGAEGVLRKPFDLDMLSETVHRHLGTL